MNDQAWNDLNVIRQTVVHIQTLAIEQDKRIAQIHRHVRDIKYAVVMSMLAVFLISFHWAKS